MEKSHENLKTIWFENEMLPKWAQILDVAAQLCGVSEQTKAWFSRFSNSCGVDDARPIIAEARILQFALREKKEEVITQLQRTPGGGQALRIFAAWEYSLDTIIQGATSKKTCSWKMESGEDTAATDDGDGNITLRRV